ncbi:hypothetical protein [Kitasatospora sp. NPDC087314]|uniref:hypothetical protein n=1 Tax=Kitasatospora sp. NPDC087314 TaxID=3364068 RepID=UPI00380A9C80
MEKMGELDDLRARLAALEAEVGRLREESAATRATAVKAGRDGTEVQSSVDDLTRAPDAVRTDRVEQHRSMTHLADAVGVMVSDQAEQTRVLRARGQTPETRISASRSSTLPQHGQFLESLLSGQSVLPEEPRREDR